MKKVLHHPKPDDVLHAPRNPNAITAVGVAKEVLQEDAQ